MLSASKLSCAAVGFVGLLRGDCGGCRDNHPYVPYSIDAETPASPADVDAGERDAQALGDGALGVAPTQLAPPDASTWSPDGLLLTAPDGLVFVLGVTADFDGDGHTDAIAIARPDGGFDPGRVLFYKGDGAGPLTLTSAFAPPQGLLGDASCTPLGRLEIVGAHAAFVELGTHCPGHPPRTPSRWVAVLEAGPSGPRLRFAATIADPAGALPITVDASVLDRDGDGRDDIALRLALNESGGSEAAMVPSAASTTLSVPRIFANLVWLDRPAGLSRDIGATESSFQSLAAHAAKLAARIHSAPEVPGIVAGIRALWRATCAEGGAPRLLAASGTGSIECGAASALEEVGLAEVRAYVTSGDALGAALALDQAERPPASRGAARVADAQKRIAKLAHVSTALRLRELSAVPWTARPNEPAWGALAFEPSGKLLVRTRAGLVRIDPDLGDEAAAPDTPAWDTQVASPDRTARWLSAFDPCDGLPLQATFATQNEPQRDVPLPFWPWAFGRCAGTESASVPAIPIAWGGAGLESLVEEHLVLFSGDLGHAIPLPSFVGQIAQQGAPRSPDGRLYVFPTLAGIVVREADRTRLLRGPALDGTYAEQRDCAVSNDGSHVACVRTGGPPPLPRAWVGTWEPGSR